MDACGYLQPLICPVYGYVFPRPRDIQQLSLKHPTLCIDVPISTKAGISVSWLSCWVMLLCSEHLSAISVATKKLQLLTELISLLAHKKIATLCTDVS